MEKNSLPKVFDTTFNLPYLMGYYLAANAVRDLCALVDGANCVMQKVDLLAGNHDLFCTLLSEDGMHRAVCSMASPLSPHKNPEKKLAALANSIAASGRFGAVAMTGLPFCRMAGIDYAGVAAVCSGKAPVCGVPPMSMEADWLDGYDATLEALAGVLPLKGKKSRIKAAVAGYFMDRNEFDHAANIKEMRRLLGLCGVELVSVWPSGGTCADLSRAGEAGLMISLPYGRKTARSLAARTGASLLETGLPMGIAGTSAWLSAVRKAAGFKGPLPDAVLAEERAASAAVFPALRGLASKRTLFAGDPHLFAAFASFAGELCSSVTAAFLCSDPRPSGTAAMPAALLFAPRPEDAQAALGALGRYDRPALAVASTFARTEGLTGGVPVVELGFPSYGHHCLADEPFLFYEGSRRLAARMLNALQSGRG